MGKAGRWIVNFLVGKKDDKHKKKKKLGSSFSAENLITSRSPSDNQNLKLKWSFRKTTGNLITHKVSKSVESKDSDIVLKRAVTEDEVEQKKKKSEFQNAAATKIQSAYRSHLARKALHALRSLVKIQALVRGHLVRKQTAATLKSMQALMAIQVRARVNRIQMVDEEPLLERKRLSSHRHLVNNNHRKVHKEKLDMNLNELWKPYKSRSGRIENEQNSYSSGPNLSISNRQHQCENYSIPTGSSTSQYYLMSNLNPERASFSMRKPRRSDSVPRNHPFYPSYMAKTESSSAKVRSQSEPKQRPASSTRSKSKHREIEGRTSLEVNEQIQNSLEALKHNGYENHNPWFTKLYQLTKTSKNRSAPFDSELVIQHQQHLCIV